jgi:hypothetical protein
VSADETTASTAIDADQQRLHELGYAQELRRNMSGFSNFAVSFTIISILSGCLTLYGYGMNTGGPVLIVWGWPFVGIMTLFVGLAMAARRQPAPDLDPVELFQAQRPGTDRQGAPRPPARPVHRAQVHLPHGRGGAALEHGRCPRHGRAA